MVIDVATLTGKNRPFIYILTCLIKSKPKLWYLLFPQLWFYLLFKVKKITDEDYQKRRWKFLNKLDSNYIQQKLKKAVKTKKIIFAENTIIVDQFPDFILKHLDADMDTSGLDYQNNQINYSTLVSRINENKKVIVSPWIAKRYLKNDIKYTIAFNDRFYKEYWKYFLAQVFYTIRDIAILGCMTFIFGLAIILMSGINYSHGMVAQVVTSYHLLVYNLIPIFVIMLILYAIFNSIAWSGAIGGFIFTFLGLVNFFMLQYRSFPFKYPDIFLSSEAMNMGHRYSYVPPKTYIIIIIALIIMLIIIRYLFRPAKQGFIKTILILLCTVITWNIVYKKFYINDDYYNSIADVKYGSKWNETDQYMTKGFVYSFVHSSNQVGLKAPAGYSDQKAERLLKKYKYQAIPKKKKVNVILVQLEAFQDFSKYQDLQIDPSVYAGLNQVRNQSMSGELTTTIFGGGTVDTERKSLTGYSEMEPLNGNTSSFVRYFDANNYYTLNMHPGYGWFYNRQNVSKYLGFNKFLYKENYYDDNVSKSLVVKDKLVFNDFNKQFDKRTKNGKKLFSQVVTYQNHGPYETTYSGQKWLPYKAGYNQADYAIINNYLDGVKQTSDQLLNLVNTFKSKKEPVVIAFWGDHNPWGGDGNSTYNMLKVNLDQTHKAGFNNYFNTPYCMWANDSAKKELKTDFKGKGPQISPMYIMPTIFSHIGIKGDEYMQLLQHLQEEVPAFGLNNRYIYDDKLVSKLPNKVQKEVDNFKIVQYYRQTHLMSN